MSNVNRSYKIAPRNLSKSEFLTPFDAIFDDMISSMFPTASRDLGENFFNKGSYPKVNVINRVDSLLIEAAIPGMSKEDVDVEVHEGVLTVRGSSNQHEDIKDGQYVKREIKRSSFQRSFRLGDNLLSSQISAAYDKGVLSLNIPKRIAEDSPSDPIKIEIV